MISPGVKLICSFAVFAFLVAAFDLFAGGDNQVPVGVSEGSLREILPRAFGDPNSKIIAVIGLDTINTSANYPEFFYELKAFVKFCEKRKSLHRCALFLNDNLDLFPASNFVNPNDSSALISNEQYWDLRNNLRRDLEEFKIVQHDSIYLPEKGGILAQFEEALQSARPGGQVMLSFIGHGLPGIMKTSCFQINRNNIYSNFTSSNYICAEDLDAILTHSLRPGVNVFIHSEACFSGGLQSLARPGVMVHTSSDRDAVSISNPALNGERGMWKVILNEVQDLGSSRPFLFLRNLVEKSNDIAEGPRSGLSSGFTSDYLRKVRCGPYNQTREDLQSIIMAPMHYIFQIAKSERNSDSIFAREFGQVDYDFSIDESEIKKSRQNFISDARYIKTIEDISELYLCHSSEGNSSVCPLLHKLESRERSDEEILEVLSTLDLQFCWYPAPYKTFWNLASWISLKSYFSNQSDFFRFTKFPEQSFDSVQRQIEEVMDKVRF